MANKINKFELPRLVLIGGGSIEEIGDVASQLSQGKSALIIAGPKTIKIAGGTAKDFLEEEGFTVSKYISDFATNEQVEGAQKAIKEEDADIVLGIGGGTPIDIAKLSSTREKIPFISIPTAASHDGMGSPIASIHDKEGKGKYTSYPTRAPIAIIADTSIIKTAPYRMTASGCADLISNYTAVEDWKLAHRLKGEYYGDYSAALSIMSAEVILENAGVIKENLETSISLVVESLLSSGTAMCIAGSSRPCSGAEHLFSHALDRIAEKPAMHGEQCGVGTILTAYLHKLDWKEFRDALKKIGAPVNAEELGISEEEVIKALTTAHTLRKRYTVLGRNGLSEEAAREVAKKTGVIQ
ncbi:MAG: NAD(P)-dependent glycerol-1-phosphate dehydrogenase [Candidatus Undinarchaeales archaeon]